MVRNRVARTAVSLLPVLLALGCGDSIEPSGDPPMPLTERVSVASDGAQGNNGGSGPMLSADGRYAAFMSSSSNMVAGDTNNAGDVFVRDRATGETTRVSVASDGTQGNGSSSRNAISADGRYVAFDSTASNLVAGDTNLLTDVFVHDRATGETTRVSVASDGTQGNGYSGWPRISADGRFVLFNSEAANLVPGDTNGLDAFVHDRATGETTLVSVASDGSQGDSRSRCSAISADGRYVAFSSDADNLVEDDTNGVSDAFVHDRETGATTRISVAPDGAEGDGDSYASAMSADGRHVVIESDATNLVAGDTNGRTDIFVHDRMTGEIERVSVATDGTQATGVSWGFSISADGRHVGFASGANNLVAGDTNFQFDAFVRRR